MIIKNVYFRKINIQSSTLEEFKSKLGIALDILNHATEDNYENMNLDAYMDWVTDLHWINERNIIIVVEGFISNDIEILMNEIINFWKNEAETTTVDGKSKNVEFIILNC